MVRLPANAEYVSGLDSRAQLPMPAYAFLMLLATAIAFPASSRTVAHSGTLDKAAIPAFPGAEGAGAFRQGGRRDRVIKVTNLSDHGPGSLREAVEECLNGTDPTYYVNYHQPDNNKNVLGLPSGLKP